MTKVGTEKKNLANDLLEKIKEYLKAEIVGRITQEEENFLIFSLPGGKKIRVKAEEIEENKTLEK